MTRALVTATLAVASLATSGLAQQRPPQGPAQASKAREDALDPSPVDPATDPDIAMFLNDYRNAPPRTESGKLVFRDILTKLGSADPVRPVKRGAVLNAITAVSYVTLAPGATARGRIRPGEREIFYTTAGIGRIAAAGKSHEVKDGIGFTLTPRFDFALVNTGKAPLAFYVRSEPMPDPASVGGSGTGPAPGGPAAGGGPDEGLVVIDRFANDRRIGAHWVHICNGGPNGMTLCTIAPHTMPQPHSHAGEEAWIMVRGDTILSLGKTLIRMHPGQAYKIPPTGLAAHSNLNMGDEPVEMLYMGPAARVTGAGSPAAAVDYGRLDNSPIDRTAGPDVDMYMGNWRDAYPRMVHGNLYVRDMLTALVGPDELHPTRKGAVLTNAQAVSHAMLEPGATAHPVEGELNGIQEVFVVDSGTGSITSGGRTVPLAKGMSFIVTPGLDFRLTATGDRYMTFYVVSETLPGGATPKAMVVVDDRGKPRTTTAWFDKERPLISAPDGLARYRTLTDVELKPMAMAQPYSSAKGVEEIWIATEGDVDMLFGKQLRRLPAGTAYRVPATGITAHANINLGDKPARFIRIVN